VRGLANARGRAAMLAEDHTVDESVVFALPGGSQPRPTLPPSTTTGPQTLNDLERQAIASALERNEGNRRKAAEDLGIGLRTLYDKLKRYDLS
jgi:two-component system response regulator FlrC